MATPNGLNPTFEQLTVTGTATFGGTSKKIKITIDGTAYYINAYTG